MKQEAGLKYNPAGFFVHLLEGKSELFHYGISDSTLQRFDQNNTLVGNNALGMCIAVYETQSNAPNPQFPQHMVPKLQELLAEFSAARCFYLFLNNLLVYYKSTAEVGVLECVLGKRVLVLPTVPMTDSEYFHAVNAADWSQCAMVRDSAWCAIHPHEQSSETVDNALIEELLRKRELTYSMCPVDRFRDEFIYWLRECDDTMDGWWCDVMEDLVEHMASYPTVEQYLRENGVAACCCLMSVIHALCVIRPYIAERIESEGCHLLFCFKELCGLDWNYFEGVTIVMMQLY